MATLFVAGFPEDMRAKDLAYEFERYGALVRCDIPAPKSPQSKLFAFVEYRDPRDAEDAHYDMRDRRIGGCLLTIQWAKNSPSPIWRLDGNPPPTRGRGRGPPPPPNGAPASYPRERSLSPPPRSYREPPYGMPPPPAAGPPPRDYLPPPPMRGPDPYGYPGDYRDRDPYGPPPPAPTYRSERDYPMPPPRDPYGYGPPPPREYLAPRGRSRSPPPRGGGGDMY